MPIDYAMGRVMRKAEIQGIIFDLDGVIADTAEMHYRSWQRLADEVGIHFDRQANEHLRGTNRELSLQRFTEGVEVDEATRCLWFERKNTYFLEQMQQMQAGDELPGVRRLLHEIRAAGLKVGVGSSSKNARPVLEQLDLVDSFDVIGDGYIVKNSKPAPDIFLWVAGALRLAPRHILVIEDSQAGVDAALTGGFYVLGVGNSELVKTHYTVQSLESHSLTMLVNALC